MSKKTKSIRERKKKNLAKHFPKVSDGDRVALIYDLTLNKRTFPKKFHGLTGKILRKQGNSYIVEFLDGNKTKTLAVRPVNIKKLN